ncbi:hypothetical protein C8J57DRAFT_1720539 [Mycena rebaudengoi]|nr:hypothetical protein C8J57DRAFT_1720539 [Mycena rebaudengoi]
MVDKHGAGSLEDDNMHPRTPRDRNDCPGARTWPVTPNEYRRRHLRSMGSRLLAPPAAPHQHNPTVLPRHRQTYGTPELALSCQLAQAVDEPNAIPDLTDIRPKRISHTDDERRVPEEHSTMRFLHSSQSYSRAPSTTTIQLHAPPSPPSPQRSGGVGPTTPGCADPHHPALDIHPVGEGQRSADAMCSLLRRRALSATSIAANVDNTSQLFYPADAIPTGSVHIPLTYSVDAAYEQSLEDEAFPSIPASYARPIVPSPKTAKAAGKRLDWTARTD